MPIRLRKMLLSPQVWLATAVFSFGLSGLLGYHQDQLAATRMMAEKVGLPPKVLIQDFDPAMHRSATGEVQILAEVDPGSVTMVNFGSAARDHWVRVVPIYPVGSEALPFAEQYLAAAVSLPRRPVPREDAAKLAGRRIDRAMAGSGPIGVIVSQDMPAPAKAADDLGLTVLGEGETGPLVRIVGTSLDGASFRTEVSAALAQAGIAVPPEMLMIAPYELGREAAFATRDHTATRQMLAWLGVLLAGLGLFQMFPILPSLPRRGAPKVARVEAVGAFPPTDVFQPIRPQEDLTREDAEAAQGPGRRIISRMIA